MGITRIFERQTKQNPFYYTGIDIPDKYFCDRKTETKKLTELVKDNNNIVLKAPRRVGKTSLIYHLFRQPEFKEHYNTIYVDIFPTKSIDDFVAVFYKAILSCPTITKKDGLEKFEKVLKDITLSAEISLPKVLKISGTKQFETIKMEKSLEALFDFLAGTSRQNLVVIDEFQQITNYDNNSIEASLRSFIQRTKNTRFIYSGSSKHLLTQIFESPTKPFYRSSRTMTLDIIPEKAYWEFCSEQFEDNDKHIDNDAFKLVYCLFSGNTFMIQQTLNGLFSITDKKGTANKNDAVEIIRNLIDEKDEDYRTYLHHLDSKYEDVLLAIASEGIATKMTSDSMRKKYSLPASTTTSDIITRFQDDNNRMVVEIAPKIYKLEDKLLELWIADRIFGNFETKINLAESLFYTEINLKTQITKRTPKKIQL